MNKKLTYSISEMAERFGVTYRTLHYYEGKIGLNINRDSSGDRIYSELDVDMFESIFDLKSKGMTLDGIRKLFIEKGTVKSNPVSPLVVIDDNTMALKDLLVDLIGEKVRSELQITNEKLDQVIKDNEELVKTNEELREILRQMQHQTDDHYNKIDEKITSWRNKKPWFSIFQKKEKVQ